MEVSTTADSREKSSTFFTNLSKRYTDTSSNSLKAPASAGKVLCTLESELSDTPVSIRTAADNGTGSIVKLVIVCLRPSSRTVKSSFVRPVTNLSDLVFTVTGTTTRSTLVRI